MSFITKRAKQTEAHSRAHFQMWLTIRVRPEDSNLPVNLRRKWNVKTSVVSPTKAKTSPLTKRNGLYEKSRITQRTNFSLHSVLTGWLFQTFARSSEVKSVREKNPNLPSGRKAKGYSSRKCPLPVWLVQQRRSGGFECYVSRTVGNELKSNQGRYRGMSQNFLEQSRCAKCGNHVFVCVVEKMALFKLFEWVVLCRLNLHSKRMFVGGAGYRLKWHILQCNWNFKLPICIIVFSDGMDFFLINF